MPLTDDQADEIAAARAQANETRRCTVPALEAILYQPIPVLDHGFIRVIHIYG